MDCVKLKIIIEAAIMVAEAPLDEAGLLALFAEDGDAVTAESIDAALEALTADYAERGIELVRVASGWRFQARARYADYVNRLYEQRPQRYSKTLTEREWVRVAGHRDVPGRPAVYATTKTFLDYFNLTAVADLPALPEMREIDEIDRELFPDPDGGIKALPDESEAQGLSETEAEAEAEAHADEAPIAGNDAGRTSGGAL
jgi:segregation and condensation protein B